MKTLTKLFFIAVIAPLAIVSCDKYAAPEAKTETDATVQDLSAKRTLDEAIKIAKDAYRAAGEAVTKASSTDVTVKGTEYVLSGPATKSSSPDTLMYVVNFDDDKGFAIVSANRATEGLMAIVESGTFDQSADEDNDGFRMFMELAKNYVGNASASTVKPSSVLYQKVTTDTTKTNAGPLLGVEWGQNDIYGKYAPNGYAGCSNTAISQIMTYFKYPATIAITYSNASVSSQALDWDKMIKHKNIRQTCDLEEEDHEAISQLLRQLGELNSSDYSSDSGTSTKISNNIKTFSKLGYTVSSKYITYSSDTFYSDLSAGKLIMFHGEYTDNNSTYGHAWVVDGTINYVIRVKYYTSPDNFTWTLANETNSTEHYLHVNWGWNGSRNGFFNAGVFKTSSAYKYDNSYTISNDHYFDTNIEYIVVNL